MKFSKNNKQMRGRIESERLQHFGIRKLTVGVASVVLSTALYLGAGQIHAVKADDSSNSDSKTVSTDSHSEIHAKTYTLASESQTEAETAQLETKKLTYTKGNSVGDASSAFTSTLPTGATATWVTKPDTSQVAPSLSTQVAVKFQDGSTKEYTVNYIVNNKAGFSSLDSGSDQAAYANLTTKYQIYKVNEAIPTTSDDIAKAVFNEKLPEGAKVDWLVEPDDSSMTNNGMAYVKVDFADGGTRSYNVSYISVDESKSPSSRRSTVIRSLPQAYTQGQDVPDDTESLGKLFPDGYPSDAISFSWLKAPDTTKVGSGTALFQVTYSDNSSSMSTISYTVNALQQVISDENSEAAQSKLAPKAMTYSALGDTNAIDVFTTSLPKGATAKWLLQPDTSLARTNGVATVQVTFSDGSEKAYQVNYSVTYSDGSRPVNRYTGLSVIANNLTYTVGDQIGDVKDAISSVPADAVVTWKTEPTTDTAGSRIAFVTVSYQGNSQLVKVAYTVVAKTVTQADKSTVAPKDNVTFNQGDDPKAEDTLTNVPEDAKVDWKDGTKPDTSMTGDGKATVVVTFPDGSTKEFDVPYTVNKKETDADKSTVTPKDNVTFNQGYDPKAEDALANVPQGAKVDWKDGTKPDTSKSGDGKTTVVVTFPDGSTKEFDVQYTVNKKETDADKYNPEGQKVTISEDDAFDPASAITNKNDLPAGTSYSVVGTIDAGKVGDQTVKVKVTYPDGSSDEIDIVVSVAAKAESTTDQTSKEDQSTSKDDKTASKNTKNTSKSSAHTQKKAVRHRVKKSSANTLPQTGEANISVLGLIAIILSGTLIFKKKDE